MIKQVFDIENYWKVIVFWNIDYNFFDDVVLEMKMAGMEDNLINEVWDTMKSGEAKAVTCNNAEQCTSIVIFNPHSTKADYINSIVHEAEHIKQALFKAYMAEDAGEPPAYAVGYIVMRMYEIFKRFI